MPLREGDPESIGEYAIESRIGTGGMGVVYLGRSASGRAVAVKVVHTQYADDPDFRARFRQEVAAARRVSGAFTAPVVDADPEAELPWMATAYVDGDTLAQRVTASGPLRWPQLRRLGVELAEALREIHRAEVVHRDLKPSNVLLLDTGSAGGGADGAVRVIDFGISRAAHSDVRTQTGLVMGSPPFMAPEQFSSPRDVGPPVDVFSLGALLVYAATGRSPFEAENAYLAAYQTVHNDPELGRIPGLLRPLVLSCLAKSPQDRPTPDAVREALAALPEELPGTEPDSAPSAVDLPTATLTTSAEDSAGNGSATLPPGTTSDPTSGTITPDTPVAQQAPATPRRLGRARSIKVAVSVVAVLAAAAVGVGVTSTSGGDEAAHEDARRGAPDGWRPWHTDLTAADGKGKAKGELPASMMPDMPNCTPSALGVYCSSEKRALFRLDPLTGRTDWTKPMHRTARVGGFTVTDPKVVGDRVLALSDDGSEGIDAFDATSGRKVWRFKGPQAEFSFLSGVVVVRVGKLGPSNTAAYAALDPRTGRELWRRTLTTDSPAPLHAGRDGTLVADLRQTRTGERTVARLDTRTGRTLGRVTAPKGDLWLATVHDGSAYYARWENDSGASSRIFIQDLTSGAVRSVDFPWAVEPEAPPLVRGDVMYVFDYANEMVLALDLKRGKALWTTSRELRVFSEPSVRGTTLFATTPDSSVVAINTRTGRERWRTKPAVAADGGKSGTVDERSPSPVAPLSVGGVLYAVTDSGPFSVAARRS
ncbi:PQQ-binding-like beta-propeller repeat protein [Streptomyces sp. NPDC058266]|uniref:protein kinase domain-containing protein n=1 Tax=Streptomyces sp. NPDC058266 TaxID=3346412 RepID=UPI0036EAB434